MSIQSFLSQPLNTTQDGLTSVGIGGFTALGRIEEGTSYSSQVPTTYLEDGTFVQDHIINAPVQITISGGVADVSVTSTSLSTLIPENNIVLENIAKLYETRLSPQATKRRNQIIEASEKRQAAELLFQQAQTLNPFGGVTNPTKNLREQFVDAMEAIYHSKQLISIDMPHRTHKNMRIVDLQITKNNKEELLSFRLTATEVQFAEVQYTKIKSYAEKPTGTAKTQTSGEKDKGKQTGEEVSEEKTESLLHKGTS